MVMRSAMPAVCGSSSLMCMTLRAIEKGRTVHTYSNGTAQFHWGLSPADHWALYNVKKDPGCQSNLVNKRPELVKTLSNAYENWWDQTYPQMIAMGGDLGDPDQGRKAAKRDKEWRGVKIDKK